MSRCRGHRGQATIPSLRQPSQEVFRHGPRPRGQATIPSQHPAFRARLPVRLERQLPVLVRLAQVVLVRHRVQPALAACAQVLPPDHNVQVVQSEPADLRRARPSHLLVQVPGQVALPALPVLARQVPRQLGVAGLRAGVAAAVVAPRAPLASRAASRTKRERARSYVARNSTICRRRN
jgi:hypothetical protein